MEDSASAVIAAVVRVMDAYAKLARDVGGPKAARMLSTIASELAGDPA